MTYFLYVSASSLSSLSGLGINPVPALILLFLDLPTVFDDTEVIAAD